MSVHLAPSSIPILLSRPKVERSQHRLKIPIALDQQMSLLLLASLNTMSTELQSSEEAHSDFRSSAANPATIPLTLMRLPPELRHRIYDFVWNEDIIIDLPLYAQPLL